MTSRRGFIKRSAFLSSVGSLVGIQAGATSFHTNVVNKPIVISTWEHGIPANGAAWEILGNSGNALDAVEAGVKIPEADPKVKSVGFGGYPDADGRVTLDACIMDHRQQCGSVACLEHILHPISIARMVMERTEHVMLVGAGALEFALQNGFEKTNLLTPETLVEWEEMMQEKTQRRDLINIENHDTIGMIAMDVDGNLAGACTTSGAATKLHGRVGDSPIIGAGLFVDNAVGAVCATGLGEEVIKQAGSAMVVELMRGGMDPESACKEIVRRIVKTNEGKKDFQVGFLALRKDGSFGAFAINDGFNFAVYDKSGNRLVDSRFMAG
jgi:isoaspartyl peptidase/L-asparaginase-like protein (Ntn-hydrolase superfamily)